MMVAKTLKIGTRGSPLALMQAGMVEEKLKTAFPTLSLERVIIKTSGDWKPEQGESRLAEIEGGKGLFVREIEEALMSGAIDCAVHSMKDVPSFLPQGLLLDHVLERADPRDALICHGHKSYMDLPSGAVIGTSSLRRQSFVLSKRPDLKIVPLRGNVATRLAKMNDGIVDATFLAMAGLNRLNIKGDFIYPLPIEEMVPACGQGIIAIETRAGDDLTRGFVDSIHHHETGLCGYAERAALQILDGSCHTPIGAHATMMDGIMRLNLVVGSVDGTQIFEEKQQQALSTADAAIDFGRLVGQTLKSRLPSGFLS